MPLGERLRRHPPQSEPSCFPGGSPWPPRPLSTGPSLRPFTLAELLPPCEPPTPHCRCVRPPSSRNAEGGPPGHLRPSCPALGSSEGLGAWSASRAAPIPVEFSALVLDLLLIRPWSRSRGNVGAQKGPCAGSRGSALSPSTQHAGLRAGHRVQEDSGARAGDLFRPRPSRGLAGGGASEAGL